MTPDDILTKDWNRVQEAALDIANATLKEDDVLCSHHTISLFKVLDELEMNYGRKASLIATRADFTDDTEVAIKLHEEALTLAKDPLSLRLSLQSLIQLLIDSRYDTAMIHSRLLDLELVTDSNQDPSDLEELQNLKNQFKHIKNGRSIH